MPPRRLLVLPAWLVPCLSLSMACGSDKPPPDIVPDAGQPPDAPGPQCVATQAPVFPAGDFGAPDTLDRAPCAPGSLSGLDPSGLWWVVDQDSQGSFDNGPVRMALDCQDGLSAESGFAVSTSPWELVSLSQDDLFLRQISAGSNWTQVETYDFCAVDSAGDLIGRAGYCLDYAGQKSCWEYNIKASRFGRLPGEDLAQGLELVGQFAGGATPWPEDFTANLDVYEGHAYVARGRDALRILDISDPASPVEVGALAAQNENMNDVHIIDTGLAIYAIVASSERGALVVDVTDPAAPRLAGIIPIDPAIGGGAHRIGLESRADGSQRIYITNGSPYVGIWDVSDPQVPIPLGRYRSPVSNARVHAASAMDDRIYVATTRNGLFVADISDPGNPVPLGQFSQAGQYSHFAQPVMASGRLVALHGDEGYGAHLEVVDVDPASPAFMTLVGALEFRPEASIHNLVVVGQRAYIAHYQEGVRVVDFSDPENPGLVGYYNTWDPDTAPGTFFEGAIDVEVDTDGLIYVADTPRGLLVLRQVAP